MPTTYMKWGIFGQSQISGSRTDKLLSVVSDFQLHHASLKKFRGKFIPRDQCRDNGLEMEAAVLHLIYALAKQKNGFESWVEITPSQLPVWLAESEGWTNCEGPVRGSGKGLSVFSNGIFISTTPGSCFVAPCHLFSNSTSQQPLS